MARPANLDPELTRRRLLRSGARLFAERGEGSVSTRQIAKAAGVSLATLHHHFGNKAGLYRACVEAMDGELAALEGELREVLAGADSLGAALEAAVRRAYRFALRHRAAVRLTLREAIDRGGLPAARRSAVLLPALDEAAGLLAALSGRSPGELRLALRSLNFLLVRYALTGTDELRDVLAPGDPAPGDEELERAVEDHLVSAARALLAPSAPEATP